MLLKPLLLLAAPLLLACLLSSAQAHPALQATASESHPKGDISGDWQGTLTLRNGTTRRTIVRITKAEAGFAAKWYSIDEGAKPISVSAMSLTDRG